MLTTTFPITISTGFSSWNSTLFRIGCILSMSVILTMGGGSEVRAELIKRVITVKDGISGEILVGQTIHAWERRSDGTKVKQWTRISNQNGKVRGVLDSTKKLFLQAERPFNNRNVNSLVFRSAEQEFDFQVGPIEILLLDASQLPPIPVPRQRTYFEKFANGQWVSAGKQPTTGNDGRVRVDLRGLGQGTSFRVRVQFQNRDIFSETITQPGSYTIVVAGALPPPIPNNWIAYHVLNRATFGGTPEQLIKVAQLTPKEAKKWATAFLKRQLELNPDLPWPTNLHDTTPLPKPIPIEDEATQKLLQADQADWPFEKNFPGVIAPNLAQLQDHDLIRKVHSRHQLLEKMVYFWDNHFNTDFRSHNQGQYELAENETFRSHAFGSFLDLLLSSAKSTAMMIYLNTTVNNKLEPNENYIREMFELHTLGVDENGNPNGYTSQDIVEGAKAFTGWSKTPGLAGGFRFLRGRHSPGPKMVLGEIIPFDNSSPSEGERVLQLAAAHPSTARHLARKLCEYFVSDTPSTALIDQIASVFADSRGNIKKVLIAIFTSREFNDAANFRTQTKTPMEFVLGIHRNLGVWSSRNPFRLALNAVGHAMFIMPVPTGYKEKAADWLNTNVLFNTTRFAFETAIAGFGRTVKFGSDHDDLFRGPGRLRIWMSHLGLQTEDHILQFLLVLTANGLASEKERALYRMTLREGLADSEPFDLTDPSREQALDRTLATMLAAPSSLYQ